MHNFWYVSCKVCGIFQIRWKMTRCLDLVLILYVMSVMLLHKVVDA